VKHQRVRRDVVQDHPKRMLMIEDADFRC